MKDGSVGLGTRDADQRYRRETLPNGEESVGKKVDKGGVNGEKRVVSGEIQPEGIGQGMTSGSALTAGNAGREGQNSSGIILTVDTKMQEKKSVYITVNPPGKQSTASVNVTNKDQGGQTRKVESESKTSGFKLQSQIQTRKAAFDNGNVPTDEEDNLDVSNTIDILQNAATEEPSSKKSYIFICMDCNSEFTGRNLLEDHIKGHNCRKRKISNEEVTCEDCGACFSDYEAYDSHVKSHNGDITCESCGRGFCDCQALKDHKAACSVPEDVISSIPKSTTGVSNSSAQASKSISYSKFNTAFIRGSDVSVANMSSPGITTSNTQAVVNHSKFQGCQAIPVSLADTTTMIKAQSPPTSNTLPSHVCQVCTQKFISKSELEFHSKCYHLSLNPNPGDVLNFILPNSYQIYIYVFCIKTSQF